jgi:predicted HD superfamily hydrolase involved in NAD metabolism
LLNLPFEQVFLAAALHDCVKKRPFDSNYVGYVPEDSIGTPVMHAFMGAAAAKKVYGITDKSVLDAIRYHTTGHADMTPLEKLIFLADMIEDGVRELRQTAKGNFEAGFLLSVDMLYSHLLNKKTDIYPLTRECYNYYFKKEK